MPGYTWHGYTWNNKGRPSGTGTVSRARAEKFKKKGEERVAREKAEAEEKARQEEQEQSAPSSLAKREEEKPAGPSTLDKREEGQPSSLAKREEEKPAETSTLDKREEEKPAEPTLVKREEGQPAASSTFLEREEEKPTEPTLDKREEEQPAPSTLVKREEEKPAEPSPLDKREKTKEQQAQDKEPTSEALGKAPSKNKQAKDQQQEALVLGPSPAQKSKELVADESPLEDSVDWGTSSSETESSSTPAAKPQASKATLCKRVSVFSPERQAQPTLEKRARTSTATTPATKRKALLDERREPPMWRLKNAPKASVAVDWHNVICCNDVVPSSSINALEKLDLAGYTVHMVSYCGPAREQQVRKKLADLKFRFASVTFTRSRDKSGGKGEWCQQHRVEVIFDDSMEVLNDCWARGLWVYCIQTNYNRKRWKYDSYPTLMDAVEKFLETSS